MKSLLSTSGADPSDSLAAFGAPADKGIGMVGETVNILTFFHWASDRFRN
jgi:hypothetical protein